MGDYYEHDLLQGICMEIMGPFQCEYEDERDKKTDKDDDDEDEDCFFVI